MKSSSTTNEKGGIEEVKFQDRLFVFVCLSVIGWIIAVIETIMIVIFISSNHGQL
jgi:hypothetical protein